MFWESQSAASPESLTVQFLQFIDWKTKDPPPPHIADDILSVVGTADIVGLHLFAHILKEYYFEMCHVLTIELDLEDLSNEHHLDHDNANHQEQRNKMVTESLLICSKLCSVICKMPNLKSLHLSLTNFPPQCYQPCLQMFNLGMDPPHQGQDGVSKDHGGYLFSGGNDVFPALEQLLLSPSIFYQNEENDDLIISTPITDYNATVGGFTTIGQPLDWSDGDEEQKSGGNQLDIGQLMSDYGIGNGQSQQSRCPVVGQLSTWKCWECTLINDHQFMSCEACGEPKLLGTGNKGGGHQLGNTPQNEPRFEDDPGHDDNEEFDEEKVLTIDEDVRSPYYPFLSFLSQHGALKSLSVNIAKRGANGISLMNRILLSVAKRDCSLDSLYIDCGHLHLHYSVRYLALVIKRSSFRRFSCHFHAMDERSVCRVVEAFNSEPHRTLSFFSIHGTGVQSAGQSVEGLVRFVHHHRELEYLKFNFFSGISRVGDGWAKLMQSLLALQTLTFIAFGEMMVDDNERMHTLCQFVGKCTTLQTIDLSISQKSYEGMGGAIENCKKFVFYAFKNQVFLQQQIEETTGILEVDHKIPISICELVVEYAFDCFGRFNLNINGLPEGDMASVGQQFLKLKQMKSRTWTTARDLQLFTHL